jgi:hypothetical protein
VANGRNPLQRIEDDELLRLERSTTVLNAAGLQRVLTDYVAYYTCSRTYLGLDKDSPTPRSVMPPAAGRIVRFRRSTGCTTATTALPRSPRTHSSLLRSGLALGHDDHRAPLLADQKFEP